MGSQEPLWRGEGVGGGDSEDDSEQGRREKKAGDVGRERGGRIDEDDDDNDDNENENENEKEKQPKAQPNPNPKETANEEEESHQVENLESLMTKMLAIRGIPPSSPPHLSSPFLLIPPFFPSHPSLAHPFPPPPSLFSPSPPFLNSTQLKLTTNLPLSFFAKDQSAEMPPAERRRFAAKAVRGIIGDL